MAAARPRPHRRPSACPKRARCSSEICEQALAQLSPAEAALERDRLLGSAVESGIAHRVFAMEAERPARIVERLLEYPLQGDFTFRTRRRATRGR